MTEVMPFQKTDIVLSYESAAEACAVFAAASPFPGLERIYKGVIFRSTILQHLQRRWVYNMERKGESILPHMKRKEADPKCAEIIMETGAGTSAGIWR